MVKDYKKEIAQRITKNLLDIQLLRLISNQPSWGYRIKKKVEKDLQTNLRHGTLYPLLNILELKGFLTGKIQQHRNRIRKVYTITKEGIEYLESYYTVLQEQIQGVDIN